ncbi:MULTISPECIES: hypothetical protein [unclassified Crossiella]|uniref:phage tail termination protein n=1 Tax=unclassified Crossiella TaxID=2620835 RepID=UPI00200048D3|nr:MULTISPECIES: hypothetical protein [unclassified Crossiella]MCK2242321.1 hypothetical protein [Crossiella sp. S99.2]MCK2254648.1 hypothetical protein [Crossiella sp. S99.1]
MDAVPPAEVVVVAVLRAALPGLSVVTLIPAPSARRMPLVWVQRTGGAAVHPLWLDRATLAAECWAATRPAAAELAGKVRAALFGAYRRQAVTTVGSLASFRELSGPAEIRTAAQPENLTRIRASYELGIRPPPAP